MLNISILHFLKEQRAKNPLLKSNVKNKFFNGLQVNLWKLIMNRPNYIAVNKPPVRSASGKYYQVNQNIQPGQGKLLYVANEKRCVRVLPRNVSSSTAPLPTPIEPSKPLVSLPPCMPTHLPESSREPLRESSVNNCVPSRIRFPKNYRLQGSELTKIHNRNAWLKNSVPAPALPDQVSDSEEDYSEEEEEDSPRSSPLFHHRHLYNFSESESPQKDLDPALSSDYDEDEEDSPRSSPLFHHRHRYNSDSETPYYSPSSESSVDYCVPSALAHHSTSESSDHQDDVSALINKKSIPAPLCTSPSLLDLVPDSEEEPSPPSSPLKFPICNNPSGPLEPVKESRPRFLGVKRVSLKGRHDVLVYSIPETDNAYVFCHERTNVDYQIFKCLKCWNEKVKTTVKVIGNEFFGNPCELSHICTPVDELEDRVERLTYKWLMDLQEHSSCLRAPKEEYANFLIWLRDDSDEDEWTRKALLNTFKQSGGYREHQELFARFCKPKKPRVEDHIASFVQQSLSMHSIYNSEKNGYEEHSDLNESFRSGRISTMEVLEWIAGISENETFYAF